MRFRAVSGALLLPLCSQAVNIISSNDDGWAEVNIRSLYSALTAAGHSVVISAPAEDESATGMLVYKFTPLETHTTMNSTDSASQGRTPVLQPS